MHRFTELIARCASFTLSALRDARERISVQLQTSAATPLVKNMQMVQLEKAISAIGMFSLFEAMLQNHLGSEGFRKSADILDAAGETELKERFIDLQRAINVLKHGRGRSYDALVAKGGRLPFRLKLPDEAFFNEGDVSEVSTLIQIDDEFVLNRSSTTYWWWCRSIGVTWPCG